MPKVHFIQPNGTEKVVDAPVGWSMMEAATKNGVSGIVADCGGACTCATCHVYVDPDWFAKLPPRSDTEEAMLEFAIDPEANSRLSCQIELSDELDGITVKVPKSQF